MRSSRPAPDGPTQRLAEFARVPRQQGRPSRLNNWRRRDWRPALDAAGVGRKRIYDLRHTGIGESLAAGLSVFEVSRYAGTPLQMISSVYGHLTFGALDTASNRLDAHAPSRVPS